MYSNGEVYINNALVTTIPNIDFSKNSVVSMAVGGGRYGLELMAVTGTEVLRPIQWQE
jgi:hypothetical protein